MACPNCKENSAEVERLTQHVISLTEQYETKIGQCDNLYYHYQELSTELNKLKQLYAEKIDAANRLYFDYQKLKKECDPTYKAPTDEDELTDRLTAVWF